MKAYWVAFHDRNPDISQEPRFHRYFMYPHYSVLRKLTILLTSGAAGQRIAASAGARIGLCIFTL